MKLDRDEPAHIEPLKVGLKPGAVPVRTKQRRYPAPKREFMKKYIDHLLRLGYVKKSTNPQWISAPLIVPKKPPAMFRLTIDYRTVNAATLQISWPMPYVNAKLADAKGAEAFAEIDFCSGYWQALLDEESQPLFAFYTQDGVVQPTRTTQGGTNSAANFQEKVSECFTELRKSFKARIDDFVLFAKSEDELLQILRRFFALCRERNLIVSLPKSNFFLKEARWCGRLVDAKGVSFDPTNLSGLRDCEPPITAGELCEYVHGIAWVSSSIPRFAERVAPLQNLLEQAYTRAGGNRKKKFIAKFILVELGWNDEHITAFRDLQNQLQESVTLVHRNTELTLCIHADASDKHWAVCATQCHPDELAKPVLDQSHQPLAFLSGTFSETEQYWTTYEREAFAVVQASRKLDFLLACDVTTLVFTDHRNLLFTFNPLALEPFLGRHKVLKVVRWALFLTAFTYHIEHIDGVNNVWPDIMTRWMRGYRQTKRVCKVARSSTPLQFSGVTISRDEPAFTWPSVSEIAAIQRVHCKYQPSQTVRSDDGLLTVDGKVWISGDTADLKLRLLTISHAGAAGHRGADSTFHALREKFYWTDLRNDVRSFVSSCVLCLLSKGNERIPRPLSSMIHAEAPNEILHFDYLFIGESDTDLRYVLVLKDDLSGYCWLEPSISADGAHAASCLARWFRVFTPPKIWVSDQGSHFKNAVLASFADTHRIRHNLTAAYSPWANGTVESLMRSILSALRALIAEFKLAPHDWASVLPLVMTALNEASLARLGSRADGLARCPLEVMTGISPERPLHRLFLPVEVDVNF